MAGHPLEPTDPHDVGGGGGGGGARLAVLVALWRVEGGSGEHAVAAACDLVVDGSVDAGVLDLAAAPHDADVADLDGTIDDVLVETGSPARAGESPFDHALRLLACSVVTGVHTAEFLTLWQHRWGTADDPRLAPFALAERWYAALDRDPDGTTLHRDGLDRDGLDAAVREEAAALAGGAASPGAVERLVGGQPGG
ncbi:hypothetical protein [Nocardioides marinquilinus]